jgi:hypothetical protein
MTPDPTPLDFVPAETWMQSYYLHPEYAADLPAMTGPLLALLNDPKANTSSRMAVWAFLDAAHGNHQWSDGRDLPRPRLRELRAYSLRDGTIREPWHMDARYGAFFATGDCAYLDAVIVLAQHSPTHPMHAAADWSIHSLARQHTVIAAYAAGAAT